LLILVCIVIYQRGRIIELIRGQVDEANKGVLQKREEFKEE
jgi:hypothetical protein